MKYLLTIVFAYSIAFAQEDTEFNNCSNNGCHGVYFNKEVMHSVMEDGCDTCHERNSKNEHPSAKGNEFILNTNKNEICLDCHETENRSLYIHSPVNSGDCIACHDPHSSSNESLLKSNVDSRLCETCHKLDYWQNKRSHGPVAGGNCFSCHEPHSSKHKKLLIQNSQNLCFMCHEELQDINSMQYLHSPFKINCISCHDSHGGHKKGILKNTIPELCYKCHENTKIYIEKSKIPHNALFETKKCINCHSPHASNETALMLQKQTVTCLECHDKEIESKNRTIKNIKQILANGKFTHSPLEDGCSTCHEPHAADKSFLLNTEFSEEIYNNDFETAFSFCFECHDENIVKSKLTSDETEFRNGTTNLHFVHSGRDKSINCSVCHNVHAAENEKLILKFSAFGKWKMPLNFQINDNGGSCLPGCHERLEYNRN
jgi:predicted CXXCH cytochrome family protein